MMKQHFPFLSSRQMTTLLLALGAGFVLAHPALAQQLPRREGFIVVSNSIQNQFEVVPAMYKKITVLIAAGLGMVGVHGLYKGAGDARSAAPLKNIFLILIGGILLALAYVGNSAGKSVFGASSTGPNIEADPILHNKLRPFR